MPLGGPAMPAGKSPISALIRTAAALAMVSAIGACSKPAAQSQDASAADGQARSAAASTGCEPGNGGIALPDGYCASVFADNLGHARHLAVASNGDVYVNTWFTERHKTTPPAG